MFGFWGFSGGTRSPSLMVAGFDGRAHFFRLSSALREWIQSDGRTDGFGGVVCARARTGGDWRRANATGAVSALLPDRVPVGHLPPPFLRSGREPSHSGADGGADRQQQLSW